MKSAVCVLFAYHEMGYACMEALLKMGAPIAALFTHRDDPHEEIWWRSCAELAARHGVPVHADDGVDGSVGREDRRIEAGGNLFLSTTAI